MDNMNGSTPAGDGIKFTSALPMDFTESSTVKWETQIKDQIKNSSRSNFWKYEEDKTLKEITDYIQSTYNSHYTSKDSPTQVMDLIESIGDAEPFSRSNAIKYLSRFGRKNGKSKLDLLKAIHYCILLYHFSGLHTNKTDEYKTF